MNGVVSACDTMSADVVAEDVDQARGGRVRDQEPAGDRSERERDRQDLRDEPRHDRGQQRDAEQPPEAAAAQREGPAHRGEQPQPLHHHARRREEDDAHPEERRQRHSGSEAEQPRDDAERNRDDLPTTTPITTGKARSTITAVKESRASAMSRRYRPRVARQVSSMPALRPRAASTTTCTIMPVSTMPTSDSSGTPAGSPASWCRSPR